MASEPPDDDEGFDDNAGGGFFRYGCDGCGNLTFSQLWYQTFSIMVCEACKSKDDYKLIAKGQAKASYLLTDKDLSKLGSLTKENPQHKSWQPMRLYLLSQVREAALKKHGSTEEIQEERQRRTEARIDGRLAKRKAESQVAEGGRPSREQERQERMRQRLESEYGGGAGAGAAGAEVEKI